MGCVWAGALARLFLGSDVDGDTVKPQHVLMLYPDTAHCLKSELAAFYAHIRFLSEPCSGYSNCLV